MNAAVQHDFLAVLVRQILPIGLLTVGFSHKFRHGNFRFAADNGRIADGPEIFPLAVLHRNRGGNDIVQVLQLVIDLMGIGADLRSDLHLGLGKICGDKGMGGLVAKGMGSHGDIAVLQHPDILLFQSDGTAQKQLLHLRLVDKNLSKVHLWLSFLLGIPAYSACTDTSPFST